MGGVVQAEEPRSIAYAGGFCIADGLKLLGPRYKEQEIGRQSRHHPSQPSRYGEPVLMVTHATEQLPSSLAQKEPDTWGPVVCHLQSGFQMLLRAGGATRCFAQRRLRKVSGETSVRLAPSGLKAQLPGHELRS